MLSFGEAWLAAPHLSRSSGDTLRKSELWQENGTVVSPKLSWFISFLESELFSA